MEAAEVTNKGGRKNNEDAVCHAESGEMRCFVLCDGLGGHESGEVASKIVAETVCAEFKKRPEVSLVSVKEYLDRAERKLVLERSAHPESYNMSTTAVVLVTDGSRAAWAHVGDSRLYYIKNGEIEFITDDHSVAFLEYESGAISYDEIRKSPNQNKLLRCVGDFYSYRPDVPELMAEVKKGDAFLLCSDGFWEYVYERDMEETLKPAQSPQEWLRSMLEILRKNKKPNNDNYSAIAVII